MKLTSTIDNTMRSARLQVAGDLDFTSSDAFVVAVARIIEQYPGLRQLRVDFAELRFCDSAGLSALLLAHRRTSTAGIHLHLDHRPPQLDRVLDITGVLDHLTTAFAPEPSSGDDVQDETVG